MMTQGSEPLYVQVEKLLLQRIGREYRSGDLIPTQQQIADETGASLITVKRALAELGRRGLIESVRGRGTVVRRERISDNHAGISSWTDSMVGLGADPRTAWTRIRTRIPPAKRARLLGMKARQRSVHIERLRLVDGEPICLMTNELPLELAPDLPERGMDHESFYAYLAEQYALRPAAADEEVVSRAASAKERRLLGADAKIVLVIRRLASLANGRPLEMSQIVARADRYRYQVHLAANQIAAPRSASRQS